MTMTIVNMMMMISMEHNRIMLVINVIILSSLFLSYDFFALKRKVYYHRQAFSVIKIVTNQQSNVHWVSQHVTVV